MSFNRPDIIRPPSEWKSYFLPLTSGCSNNTCTFCGYYGSKLQIRDVADVKSEIDALALFTGSRIRLPNLPEVVYAIAQDWDGKRIFLQDGDALVYPFPKLREVLQYLSERLPSVERIGTYATPQDILRRSVDELKELTRLKLGIFYTGLETGDDELLQKIGKGVSSHQIVEAGKKVKEAGISFSVTIILDLAALNEARNTCLRQPEFSLRLIPIM
jgi:radical SAM superfamily enzyme YgiQ (UPF0313 family)